MLEHAFAAEPFPDVEETLRRRSAEASPSHSSFRTPARGEVFTRRWVAELILDLVGYSPGLDLGSLRLVEPACGKGAFLLPVVDRLVASCAAHGRDLASTEAAISAFDVSPENVEAARRSVVRRLVRAGLDDAAAARLAQRWITQSDFLLAHPEPESADFVVGNPPYVRLEDVDSGLMRAYRRACSTMRGRSDLYVGFIEHGLRLLTPSGALGFICADRWMRNQYGGRLRRLVAERFSVDTIVSMHDVPAFESQVAAYPATFVLRRAPRNRPAVVATAPDFGPTDAPALTAWLRSPRPHLTTSKFTGSKLTRWFTGEAPWPSAGPAQLAVIADLEARFPTLEESAPGTRVGIGVATGRDDVFITEDSAAVEGDRLLPLVRSKDANGAGIRWTGAYLVNPWTDTGLVDLADYPRLREYFERHAERIRARHVARRRPDQWYRTIDRVDPHLRARPKLLLPDLKASAQPVLDEGCFYPHHNLYYVVSDSWDPEVLGGLLLSDIANLFVGAYCVRMRGGCLRFQAQYLRRIRVPPPSALRASDAKLLATGFATRDVALVNAVARRVYGYDAPAGSPVAFS